MARVSCALALSLLSACFVDPGNATGATLATTTASATSADPTTTADPLTTSDATGGDATVDATGATTSADPQGTTVQADVTGDPTTDPSTSGGDECSAFNAACSAAIPCCGCLTCSAGVCTSVDGDCPPCEQCGEDAECAPGPDSVECQPDPDPCPQTVFGLEDGVCYAYAPATGTCKNGACAPGACVSKGDPVIDCPACLREDHKCVEGVSFLDHPLGAFCHVGEDAPNCQPGCDGGVATKRTCDESAVCVDDGGMSCDGYACDPGDAECMTSCNDDTDCEAGYICEIIFNNCELP